MKSPLAEMRADLQSEEPILLKEIHPDLLAMALILKHGGCEEAVNTIRRVMGEYERACES